MRVTVKVIWPPSVALALAMLNTGTASSSVMVPVAEPAVALIVAPPVAALAAQTTANALQALPRLRGRVG